MHDRKFSIVVGNHYFMHECSAYILYIYDKESIYTCSTGDTIPCVSRIASTEETIFCSNDISTSSKCIMTVVQVKSTLINILSCVCIAEYNKLLWQ